MPSGVLPLSSWASTTQLSPFQCDIQFGTLEFAVFRCIWAHCMLLCPAAIAELTQVEKVQNPFQPSSKQLLINLVLSKYSGLGLVPSPTGRAPRCAGQRLQLCTADGGLASPSIGKFCSWRPPASAEQPRRPGGPLCRRCLLGPASQRCALADCRLSALPA